MKRTEKRRRIISMPKLSIGDLELENPFFAAPMAGISDAPMRKLCREMGASLVYSEMVSGKGLIYHSRKTAELLKMYDDEGPVAFQIFGSEPEVMEQAARMLSGAGNAILDINMGCPVPKIVSNGEGSALLENLQRLHDVAAAVVRGSGGKPVTAKIRIGWDEKSIVAPQAAIALEAAGVSAVAVHGRTRSQFYTGRADWDQIARVKKAVSVPVIGNGDVFSAEDGMRMMEETGCDFVMVARGMLGNPWIFRELNAAWRGRPVPPPPTKEERLAMMLRHFDMLQAEKGERRAVLEMRKHAGWYIRGIQGAARMRSEINRAETAAELKHLIETY
jgi:tRNA-dihydrouridine synthase B